MRKRQHNLIGLICFMIVAFYGCKFIEQAKPSLVIQEYNDVPMMVLPPLIACNANCDALKKELSNNMLLEVARVCNGNVINALDFEQINHKYDRENLMLRGRFNNKELAAICRLAEAKSILSWNFIQLKQYKPQKAQIQIIIIDKDTKVLNEKFIIIDLSQFEEQQKFKKYVEQMTQENYWEPNNKDNGHKQNIAELSPKTFRNYITHKLARQLFYVPAQLGESKP